MLALAVARGKLCHGLGRVIADKGDLFCKVAGRPASGQSGHAAAVFADIDKKTPATRAGAARGEPARGLSASLPCVFGESAC
ncbi:hypothetical protein FHX59_006530 [Paraburkholderia silvatlantica]|uniref:Uncharacterized protein n=1 Tax=Paraburkholderia silvatlantica TaxID=321895 RepID=A0ABR6FX97_9BURK|nr:hypothetical protein [Paraburkholderia silvatlantica]PVY24731.1 hypothetical protein C7411_127120 [Paraburkholderia silvatlantica]PXW31227.1 hypothetical protein C7413_126120 [Paraburkholderia silvatlantica]